jgi:hypothetical protein
MQKEQVAGHLKAAGVAAVIGMVVSSFHGIALWPQQGFRGLANTVIIGAVIGVVIYASVRAVQFVSGWIAAKLHFGPRAASAVHLLSSLAGGFAGGLLGLVLGVRLLGGDLTFGAVFQGRGRPFLIVAATVAVLASIAFKSYDVLKNNLRAAVERLKEREWAEKELQIARSIQKRLLPPEEIEGEGFSISARNLPARLVAGDFYDFVRSENVSVSIVAADVAGKGMGASLIMASVKAVLPYVAHHPVSETMAMLNEKLINELERREFVALAFARFFPATRELHLANAGFPDPYLVRGGSVQTLTVPGIRLPLGIRRDASYETSVTRLQPHDRVLFVSDGLPEAPTSSDAPLGYERLADLIRQCASSNGSWVDAVLARVRAEVKPALEDDWTAVALEVR